MVRPDGALSWTSQQSSRKRSWSHAADEETGPRSQHDLPQVTQLIKGKPWQESGYSPTATM